MEEDCFGLRHFAEVGLEFMVRLPGDSSETCDDDVGRHVSPFQRIWGSTVKELVLSMLLLRAQLLL
jgi:hypothetical protein